MTEIDEVRRFDRLCLEQAELCVLEESRQALLTMAGNYEARANAIKREQGACYRNCYPTRLDGAK